jgi:TolA-binding protein
MIIEGIFMSEPNETLQDEMQQKVRQLEESLQRREDELATAEAQRDEIQTRLLETENRVMADRALHQAGVVDVEAAALLLSKRVDITGDLTPDELTRAVEQLLLDKPFLRAAQTHMPPATRTGRDAPDVAARMADAAERAVASGNRRDVVEYLRLRRATMK